MSNNTKVMLGILIIAVILLAFLDTCVNAIAGSGKTGQNVFGMAAPRAINVESPGESP